MFFLPSRAVHFCFEVGVLHFCSVLSWRHSILKDFQENVIQFIVNVNRVLEEMEWKVLLIKKTLNQQGQSPFTGLLSNIHVPTWQFWDSGGVKLESLCNCSIVVCQWTVNCLLGSTHGMNKNSKTCINLVESTIATPNIKRKGKSSTSLVEYVTFHIFQNNLVAVCNGKAQEMTIAFLKAICNSLNSGVPTQFLDKRINWFLVGIIIIYWYKWI